MKRVVPPGVPIHRTDEVSRAADGRDITVPVASLPAHERTELEVAVTTELAPAMALALLSITSTARANRDELEPALEVFCAAVVRSSSPVKARLQLLFDKGAVLPIELTIEAAMALSKGLAEYLGSSQRRLAERRGETTSS